MKKFLIRNAVITLALLFSLSITVSATVSSDVVDVAKQMVSQYKQGAPLEASTNVKDPVNMDQLFHLVKAVAPPYGAISAHSEWNNQSAKTVYTMNVFSSVSQADLDAALKQAVTEATTGKTDDVARVKGFHDWLVLNTVYDTAAAAAPGPQYAYAFSAEGPLIYGKGVCDGYSRALMLMCQSVGIPAVVLSSNTMNHSFNAVYLENQWQLLDVTWDDPVPDLPGKIQYTYFLSKTGTLPDHTFDKGTGKTLSYEDYIAFGNWYYADTMAAANPENPKPPIQYSGGLAILNDSSPTQRAESLQTLGIFHGSDKGFDLDRQPNRIELATMFVRVLGLESKALEPTSASYCPFTDVPQWAKGYVGILFHSGLANGRSSTTFGALDLASAKDYATFLLRALNYDDSAGDFTWNNSLQFAASKQVGFAIPNDDYAGFTRGDMVDMTMVALSCPMAQNGLTLLESLSS